MQLPGKAAKDPLAQIQLYMFLFSSLLSCKACPMRVNNNINRYKNLAVLD